jgi:phosphinothricin acetyltransferase
VGQGLGLRLYSALFDAIETADIHRLYAGISLPNEASVGFHLRMGFALIGIYREVGRKFGRFWDVGVYERPCPKL